MGMTLPRLTPEALKAAVLEMCEGATEMIRLTRDAFYQHPTATLDKVSGLGRDLHHREKRLTDHVAAQLHEAPWSLGPTEHLAFLPAALERIGDQVEALARCVQGIHREGVPFSDRAFGEIMSLFNRGGDLLTEIANAIRTGDQAAPARIREAGAALQTLCDEAAMHHQDRVLHRTCTPRASSVFLAMLDYFREIERYVRRMSTAVEKSLLVA